MSLAPPRRKVLVLVDLYVDPYGGTEGQIRALLAGLPAGWYAEMWVLRPPGPWLRENVFPCPVRTIGWHRLASPSSLGRLHALARRVRARGFDVIQTYMNDASIIGPLLAYRAGIPCFVARRDLGFWQTPPLLEVLRRTGRLARGVVANCTAVKKHTIDAEHVPPGLVHVIGNGHDPARFDRPREPGLRDRFAIPPGTFLVGLLANVKPLKRHDDLLAAVARLGPTHPHLHALLIGEAVEPGEPLDARARARGIGDRVHVTEAPGNAIPLLQHVDVGILCSSTEGLSNAIIEYMACGLPTIATRVGGTPDLVIEEETGLLYEPGDVEALAAHVARLADDAPLRARMGQAARARYEAHFTAERMVAATTAVWAAGLTPPARAEDLGFEVLTDVAAVEALADDWDALLGPHQIFLGPDWTLAWLAHGRRGDAPHVVVARDATGRRAGVLPHVRHGSVLGFPGQGEGADHLDVVAADGRALDVARGALDVLQTLPWTRLALHHLTEDGALRRALREAAPGLPSRERYSTTCPYAETRGRSYDAYVAAHFSYASRRNIRRYPKRFRALEGAGIERLRAPAQAAAGVDRFLALHETRFARRGETSALAAAWARPFHRDLATRMAARGRLSLTFLTLQGRDVACEYAFLSRDKVYAFQSGFDDEAPIESPGLVLQAIVFEEDVFGAGRAEYDFLDGTEDYKLRWATSARRLFDVEVYPPTAAGRGARFTQAWARFAYDLWRSRGENGAVTS